MKRILSGMRPTGPLHLGHLLGALSNWVELSREYECFFMIADWHALMSEYENPKDIRKHILGCAADWIACGIDPKKSVIFIQSEVPQHLELYMALSDITPLSWLERCPTYKEQLREQKTRNLATFGFLGYPVLQAADILLYKANAVPVGEDQLPHLEITREIARKFNSLYKSKVFIDPKALLTKTSRLLGTDNRKMSKTFDNFIALSDTPDMVKKKVMGMITDPKRVKRDDPGHPDVCNVCSYYKAFKPDIVEVLHKECVKAQIGCTDDKKRLADILIEILEPIQKKRKKLLDDKAQLQKTLDTGTKKARDVASDTMQQVRKLVGLA